MINWKRRINFVHLYVYFPLSQIDVTFNYLSIINDFTFVITIYFEAKGKKYIHIFLIFWFREQV